MQQDQDVSYQCWLDELRALAVEADVQWLIGRDPMTHRRAFEQGLSAEEQLSSLLDMAQWRGCGCGAS